MRTVRIHNPSVCDHLCTVFSSPGHVTWKKGGTASWESVSVRESPSLKGKLLPLYTSLLLAWIPHGQEPIPETTSTPKTVLRVSGILHNWRTVLVKLSKHYVDLHFNYTVSFFKRSNLDFHIWAQAMFRKWSWFSFSCVHVVLSLTVQSLCLSLHNTSMKGIQNSGH